MGMSIHVSVPVKDCLRKLGSDLNEARRRRKITKALMAERAGIAINTLTNIEKGEPGVSMAAYASVLNVLGLIENPRNIADQSVDGIGMLLDAKRLPKESGILKRSLVMAWMDEKIKVSASIGKTLLRLLWSCGAHQIMASFHLLLNMMTTGLTTGVTLPLNPLSSCQRGCITLPHAVFSTAWRFIP
ncbi:MAG: helix-turn-helix domain-containing protein [Clostridiales bacterium]|jgi:transcriptional regulator with XRE-family HTH domain|nr:helix-turn-helix domain-containing protein [Clostridiales bacterium]